MAILAVGDGFATLVGVRFGVHKIFEKKSAEGTLSFFLTASIAAAFFVPPVLAIAGALAGALGEMALGHPACRRYRSLGADDNLFSPLAAAVVIQLLSFVL